MHEEQARLLFHDMIVKCSHLDSVSPQLPQVRRDLRTDQDEIACRDRPPTRRRLEVDCRGKAQRWWNWNFFFAELLGPREGELVSASRDLVLAA
jgi:hypothetical protein